MVYRRYTPRRTNYRRRRYRRPTRGKVYGAAFSQLARDVSKLKGMLNVEYKSKDVAVSETPNTTGTVIYLNDIAGNDSLAGRDGLQVRLKSLQMRLTSEVNVSDVDTFVRIMVVIDKQPQGALPSITDILESTSITSVRNLSFRKRFVILKDTVQKLRSGAVSNNIQFMRLYKRLDMKSIYNSTGSGISNIESNGLFLVLFSDEATNPPTISGTTRVRYLDN